MIALEVGRPWPYPAPRYGLQALLPAPTLAWIVLATAGSLSLDAPYCPGLAGAGHQAALRAATAMARAWTPAQRGLVTLATVDTATGLTAALRAVSLTRAWWTALADTLDACGPTTPAERDAAMARDYRRWPRTADMLGAAAAAEIAGL